MSSIIDQLFSNKKRIKYIYQLLQVANLSKSQDKNQLSKNLNQTHFKNQKNQQNLFKKSNPRRNSIALQLKLLNDRISFNFSNSYSIQPNSNDQLNISEEISKESKFKTSIHSFGFGGAGQNNIIFKPNHKALIPIGPNIGIWDLNNAKRVGLIQSNKDSIFMLLETTKILITISVSGQVSILDQQTYKQICQFNTKSKFAYHAASNEKYLVILCQQSNDKFMIEVYSIQIMKDNIIQLDFIKSFQPEVNSRIEYVFLTENDSFITLSEGKISEEISLQDQDIKKEIYNYNLSQYNLISENLINKVDFPQQSKIQCFKFNSQFGAIITKSRNLIIFDLQSFLILSSSFVNGSSNLISSISFLNQSALILSPANNFLLKIYCSILKQNPLPSQINGNQEYQEEGFEIKIFSSEAISPNKHLIQINDNYIFSTNDEGFLYQNIYNSQDKKSYSSNLKISATSLAVNKDGNLIAVGDITGNILIYQDEDINKNYPIAQATLESGIRSLEWFPSNESIAIGTFDGSILRRQIFSKSQCQPEIIAKLEGSITTLRFKIHNKKLLLLATNTIGQIVILEQDQFSNNFSIQTIIQAHSPQNSSNQFGTLNKFAEIWGSSWDCNGASTIATSSEDQQICIFDLNQKQPQLVQQLNGHKLAVTALDWKKMNNSLGDVFISCSDDQNMRIYNPLNNFQLIETYSTSFINEWHTLTYLSLEEGGSRVAIGAQNGFLFIIDLVLKKFIFAEKIHMGGIEGVVWRNNKIYTCSNDCTLNIIKI